MTHKFKSDDGTLTEDQIEELALKAMQNFGAPDRWTIAVGSKAYKLYHIIKTLDPEFKPMCEAEIYFKANELGIE